MDTPNKSAISTIGPCSPGKLSRRIALIGAGAALPAAAGDFRWLRHRSAMPAEIGRYIAAGVSALAVGSKTPVTQYPGASWVDWTDEPSTFVAGPVGIDACYVGETPDEMLLVFRPTEAPQHLDYPAVRDWLNDFHAITVSATNMPGLIHKGFWQSVSNLMKTRFTEEIRRRQARQSKPITIVGYSKGGGMAPLAAVWLSQQGIQASKVMLFEAPRCGNTDFAAAYQKKFPQTTRYEFQNDLIVHLPPTEATLKIVASIPVLGPLLGAIFGHYAEWNYEPVGRLQFIDWNAEIREASTELSKQRELHLLELVLSPRYKEAFSDHLPCGFTSALVTDKKCPWDYFRLD